MSLDFHWFLPTSGDSRHLIGSRALDLSREKSGVRAPDADYLTQVALAAEQSGFTGALIPTGGACEDSWIVAAALSQRTKRLKFLVAFRPGFVLPAVAAHTAASLQKLTGNRLLLNVVTGGSSAEQRSYGDFLGHDERYERTAEFLTVVRGVWQGRGFNFNGKYYQVENGGLFPLENPPTLYFGGASPAAEQVAARHADVYLLWGETPGMVAPRLSRMRHLADAAGRKLKYGIRLHVISRDTEEEAWQEAERLIRGIPEDALAEAQRQFAASESVGQARMVSLHKGQRGNARDLEVYPNLWAGIGLVRGGAGTALIGSHKQVAERIHEYASLGLETFILSGYPNVEEAYRFGEEVLPLVQPNLLTRKDQA
jgi:alkanesulfonate monooxygenase